MASDTRPGASPASRTPRPGRPRLTDAQRTAVRHTIAHAALGLFAEHGVAATTVEQIASAAGVSVRTLWRYASSKEDCVRPLLEDGVAATARTLRSTGHPTDVAPPESLDDVRTLVRLTRTEPGLRAVWLEVHDAAEPVFASALAVSTGVSSEELAPRVTAAVVNSVLRVAVEEWAWHGARTDAGGLDATVGRAVAVGTAAVREWSSARTDGSERPGTAPTNLGG